MATPAKRSFRANDKGTGAEPVFTVTVAGDIGPFKQGQELTRDKDIALYFRLALNEGADTETTLDDKQIFAGVKSVDVTGLDADDADIKRVQHLEGLSKTVLGEDDVPETTTPIGVSAVNSMALNAMKYGSMVDDEFEQAVDKGVEGKKDYDGAPLLIEANMVRLFGDMIEPGTNRSVMHTWPVIGTRRQGSKNDTVPPGMEPAEWQKMTTPVDFYRVQAQDGTEIKGRWLGDFVGATPHGKPKVVRINQLKALAKGTVEQGTPADLLPLQHNAIEAESLLAQARSEWTSMLNRIGRAILLWQQKQAIEENLPKVAVAYAGASYDDDGNVLNIDQTAKRNKPIILIATNPRNPKLNIPTAPISLTKFLNLKVERAKRTGGTVASLLATAKRDPKKPGDSTVKAPVRTIENVSEFSVHAVHVSQYLDAKDTRNAIMKALATPEGGQLASEMVYLADSLEHYTKLPSVRQRAAAFDKAQLEAVAAADAAAAELKVEGEQAA